MYRLSLIISEVYNKYLPLAEQGGVSLNLDFSDTTKTVTDPEAIKTDLDKHLSSILGLSERGEITISVEQNAIVITDSNTILSKPICALLSKGRVSVNSRVGFGTTVRISLLPPEPVSDTESLTKLPETTPATKLASSKLTTPTKTAKTTKATKPTPKSKSKPTRGQRKLASAAKKADRKIQKLRKPQPTTTKSSKSKPSKTKSPKPKTAKKTHKRVIELS